MDMVKVELVEDTGDEWGRNLLRNSDFSNELRGWDVTSSGIVSIVDDNDFNKVCKVEASGSIQGIYRSHTTGALTDGETYTLSAMVKADTEMSIGVAIDGYGLSNGMTKTIGTSWEKVVFTRVSSGINTLARIYSNSAGTFYIAWVKTEKGNTATDWTPAPEDVQEQLDEHNTRISTAELKITDSAIVSTVRNSTAYNNDLSGKVGTTEIISKINQSAEVIQIQASKIKLEGLVTANSNFKILSDGSIQAKNANISGTVTSSAVTVTGGTITGTLIRTNTANDRIELGNNVLQVYSGANKSMEIHKEIIRFYDWQGTTRVEPVGRIYSTRKNNSPNQPGIVLANEENAFIALSYREGDSLHPYAEFDIDNVNDYKPEYPIKFWKSAYFANEARVQVALRFADSATAGIWHSVGNHLVIKAGTQGFVFQNSNADEILGYSPSNNIWRFRRSVQIDNNLTISGHTAVDRHRGRTAANEFYIGDGNCRIDTSSGAIRLYTTAIGASSDTGIRVDANGTLNVVASGVTRHCFANNGTKSGGTIEVEGTTYGMSPIDSPQVLIEDVLFDVKVNGRTKIQLDNIFAKSISKFAVFSNCGQVEIVEKGEDYFVVDGYTGTVDFRIVGKRVNEEHRYFEIMGGFEHGVAEEVNI
jgi:hypothetical protein